MSIDLDLTSVPSWGLRVAAESADNLGRTHTIVSIGEGTEDVVAGWLGELEGASFVVRDVPDVATAIAVVESEFASARVGWRLLVVGTAAEALAVRARALALGVTDDELTMASTSVDVKQVMCVHCDAVTPTTVGIDEVMQCGDCGRNLLVYHHVSRLRGAFLGYMVDAEEGGH